MNAIFAIVKLTFKEIVRKKDFYVALALIGVILFFASRMNFYDVENVSRYLRELGLALIFVFSAFITVPLAARQFPSETRDRTLAVLLAKPVSRGQFVLGKFLGAALAGVAAFTVFYAVFLAFTLKGLPDPRVAVQAGILFAMGLAVLAAVATGLSFYLTFSANVMITLAVYLLMIAYGPDLRDFFNGTSAPVRMAGEVLYYGLPHFEFFDLRQRFIHDWGTVSTRLVCGVYLYGVCYTGFFLLIGWLKLRRTAA